MWCVRHAGRPGSPVRLAAGMAANRLAEDRRGRSAQMPSKRQRRRQAFAPLKKRHDSRKSGSGAGASHGDHRKPTGRAVARSHEHQNGTRSSDRPFLHLCAHASPAGAGRLRVHLAKARTAAWPCGLTPEGPAQSGTPAPERNAMTMACVQTPTLHPSPASVGGKALALARFSTHPARREDERPPCCLRFARNRMGPSHADVPLPRLRGRDEGWGSPASQAANPGDRR